MTNASTPLNVTIITDRISRESNTIGRVRLSVRPFDSTLSFTPTGLWPWFLHVYGS